MTTRPNAPTSLNVLRCLGLALGALTFALAPLAAQGNKPETAERGLLVKPKAGARSDVQVAAEVSRGGGRVKEKLHQLDVHVVRVPADKAEGLRRALAQNPAYEYVEEDAEGFGFFIPNDPLFPNQWHHGRIGTAAAWEATVGSSTMVIAVLDTGIQHDHPDLAGKILPGYDYVNSDSNPADDHGHGTSTAGTAAAIGNNAAGVAGLALNCRILPLKVLDSANKGYYSNWAKAIMAAADQGAKVINMSFGGSTSSSTLQSAVDYAWNKGVVLIAAAGNSGSNTLYYPAACRNVVAVSATNSSDSLASWSTWGNQIDLAAPGDNILTTTLGGGYGGKSGTSFASPVVAGAAALVASQYPTLSNADIVRALTEGADDLGTAGWDDRFGFGRVNAARALAVAATITSVAPDRIEPVVAGLLNNGTSGTLSGNVAISVGATDEVGVARIDLLIDGAVVASTKTSSLDYLWNTSNVADGQHTVSAVAYDAAGNAGRWSQAVETLNSSTSTDTTNLKTGADTTAPTVAITSPKEGATVSKTVKIGVQATDNVGVVKVEVYANGRLIGSATTGTATINWNTAKVAKGTYTLVAVAYDAAGNAASSSPVRVVK